MIWYHNSLYISSALHLCITYSDGGIKGSNTIESITGIDGLGSSDAEIKLSFETSSIVPASNKSLWKSFMVD